MNQQSIDFEIEAADLQEKFGSALRLLTQLSTRLLEPLDAGFVQQCAKVKEIVATMAKMTRDLPDHGFWAEPFGKDRPGMLVQVGETLEALAAASEKLGELRRQAIGCGSTS